MIPSAESPPADLRTRFPFLGAPLEEGEVGWLGAYRILGVLGEGGMGVVFEAEDSHLRRRVALKVMKPELAANLVYRQRFLHEARAAAGLPSDHVVTIYQVGMTDDVPFLAMQLLQGESLEQRLWRAGPLPWAEVAEIGRQVAEGLAVAHDQGLIHRDIKPANIWLESRPDGAKGSRVKLLDFGLARAANGPSHLTASGVVVGTPQYLAPEQARGQSLDGRCDLFSLGAVLYRLLTDRLPFKGDDPLALLTALAVDEPVRVEELAPGTPPPLAALVHQLLAKKPDDRPGTARDVAQRLRAITEGTTPAEAPALPQSAPVPKVRRRRRWLIPMVGSILLGLAAGVALLAFGKRGRQTAAAPAGEPIKVGVMFSLSGTLATSGGSVTDATLLAIDEVNERGGIGGRLIQKVVVDGASDSHEFARLAEQLITRDKVCAVFGCWTSAGRRTVRPIFEHHDNLLFYPVQYEGLEQSPNIVYLGATPNQQILPALRYAIDILGKRRLFLAGSDYVFPHCANRLIRDAFEGKDGVTIVGEDYLPLGGGEEERIVNAILTQKADLIVNTVNGDANTSFFRALRRAGITPDRVPTLSFSMGENELRGMDVRSLVGDYAAWNYFQSIHRPENAAFVEKFRARFGPQRVVSDPMESAYTAVHLWAAAVAAAGTTEPAAVRRALRGRTYDAPGGPVRIDSENQHTWKVARIGRIVSGGQFEIVWTSPEPIRPEPYPPIPAGTDVRAYWDGVLKDLYNGWGRHWEAPHH